MYMGFPSKEFLFMNSKVGKQIVDTKSETKLPGLGLPLLCNLNHKGLFIYVGVTMQTLFNWDGQDTRTMGSCTETNFKGRSC